MTTTSSRLQRRGFVKAGAMFPLAALGGLSFEQALAATGVPGYQAQLLPTQAQIYSWVQMVNSTYGPLRTTGDANHVGYVNWLANQIAALPGITLKRDTYTFKRWEADMIADTGATLNLPGGQSLPLDVLHYYPYTGEAALGGPVTGPIIYLAGDGTPGSALSNVTALMKAPPANLAQSIVVIESPCSLSPASTLYGTYPANLTPKPPTTWAPYQGFAHGTLFSQLDGKCLGIIFCWTDVGDEAARFQYTRFSQPHRQTPALWVGKDTALLLKSFGGTSATITMKLSARVFPNTPTDTLIATLPGQSTETVIIASHTDGPNICEENGSLGLLAMATYASQIPISERNRTLVFAMVTGHCAGGALTDPATATGPYGALGADSSGFYRDHPEIVQNTVAALGVEHLGGMEWVDDPSHTYYAASGQVDAEHWYIGVPSSSTNLPPAAGLQTMANITLAAAQGEPTDVLRMQVEMSGQVSPMASAASSRGIVAMGLIPVPSYLLLAGPTGSIEKINPERMHTQIEILTKMLVVLDKLSAAQINGIASTSATDLDPSQGTIAAAPPAIAATQSVGGCTVGSGVDASLPIMAGLATAGMIIRRRKDKARAVKA